MAETPTRPTVSPVEPRGQPGRFPGPWLRALMARVHIPANFLPAGVAPAAQRVATTVSALPFARAVKPCLYVALPVVLLSAFAVGIVYVRLLQGPMSLKVLTRMVERGITAELSDTTAHIDDVQLTFSKEGGFEFRIINVRLMGADGETMASAPLAAIELSSAALRKFRVVPERIDLIEPHLTLFYSHETGVSLSLAGDKDEAASPPDAAGAAPQVLAPAPPSEAPSEKEFRGLLQAPLPLHAVASQPADVAPPDAAVPAPVAAARPILPSSLRRIDLARVLAKRAAVARRGEDASSFLRQVGLRDATVSVDYAGKLTQWVVQELDIDLEHVKQRSVISGMARIDSARGPWVMTFMTDDSDKTQDVKLTASLRDLVPSALGQALPEFGWLQTLNLPVSGDASVEVSTAGILKSATLALELGRGEIILPSLSAPLALEAGLMQISYDAVHRVFTLSPSTLKWGESHMTVAGDMTGQTGADGQPEWHFGLHSTAGSLATDDAEHGQVPIDEWTASGRLAPHQGLLELSGFDLKAGGGHIALQGQMTTGSGPPGAKLAGQISPMPLPVLKALWPRAVAPDARRWVAQNITKGEPGAGTLSLSSGRYLEDQNLDGPNLQGQLPSVAANRSRLTFALEASAVQIKTADGVRPIDVPRALVRLENDALEIAMPDATLEAPSGKKIAFKGGRFTVTGLGKAIPEAGLQVKTQTALGPVIEVLVKAGALPKLAGDVPLDAIEGKADAAVDIKFPLATNINLNAVTLAGKAILSDLKCKQKIKGLDLTGGSITIDASAAAVQAKGDILVNGVQMKLDGQRLADIEPDKQPPLRISAILDNADRTQLGLDINHLVQGELPIEISVSESLDGAPKVQVRADLTNADVGLHDIAWMKPAGRAATAQFDVAKGKANAIELQNFKVAGDNVAIEGWLSVDEGNEVREFYFPDFSLNVVSRVEVRGKLSPAKIWKISAKGATFDGRDLFRALVSINASEANRIRPLRPCAGLDLEASIGTILGHSDVALRDVFLRMSERDDKLTALRVEGTLDGGQPLKVLLRQQADQPRVVYADSTDAGQAFRLVGFYPNLRGGRVRLEVNLDGKGAASKTGVLSVDEFKILGDPVVAEVFSGAPESVSGGAASKRVTREEFEFDHLRIPFSAGHGQFVLEESYLRGPVLGATVRGKIDHVTQRLSLGGTYVPLQGINSALCGIPIVGQIITGIKCEGLLGITYAIQGPISKPQVVVNPFSMVAPGIFREIFQMTNPDPKVQVRDDPKPAVPVEARVRASSSEVSGGAAVRSAPVRPATAETIDGWSSQSAPAKATP